MKSIPRAIAFFLVGLPFAFALSQRQYLPSTAVTIAAVFGWGAFTASALCVIRAIRD